MKIVKRALTKIVRVPSDFLDVKKLKTFLVKMSNFLYCHCSRGAYLQSKINREIK